MKNVFVCLFIFSRDAIFVSLSNCLTSVFAGFVVFAYIGYLANITGQSIDDVIQAGWNKISKIIVIINFIIWMLLGQGLAFVVYPYAVTTIPVAPLWVNIYVIYWINNMLHDLRLFFLF